MTQSPSNDNHCVDVFRHPDQFSLDVRQLFERAAQEDFQFGVPWYENLVNSVYPDHSGVHIYVLRRSGNPIAALPILATRTILGWQLESLSNYYTSLYAPAIAPEAKDSDLALLIKAVLDAHSPAASLRFSPIDSDSKAYYRLQNALKANGLFPFGFFCFSNWYLIVTGNWSTYLLSRTGTLRSTIKRMSKKLLADGGKIELVLGGTALKGGIEAFEQVYAESWKKPEPYPKFIPGLMQMCAVQGALRLGLAKLNGQPIAAQLWIVANGKAYIYKVAYDEKFKIYTPGTLLTAMLMQHVLDSDQVKEVDFLTGDDPYKKSWMSHRRERWGIIAYNPKTISGIIGLSKTVLGRVLKPILMRVRAL